MAQLRKRLNENWWRQGWWFWASSVLIGLAGSAPMVVDGPGNWTVPS